MTAISPVPRWWTAWLGIYYPAVRGLVAQGVYPGPIKALIKLSMISFARWSVFDRVPAGNRGTGTARLSTPYLLFETNFDGDSNQYLEAFSLITPWGMRGNWWGAYGFPNIRRTSRFQDYVNEKKVQKRNYYYYYSAYPDASTKMVRVALELRRELNAFKSKCADMSSPQFQRAYLELITKVQSIRNPRPKARATRSTEALTVLSPIQPCSEDGLRRDLARLSQGPKPVPYDTHFARWLIAGPLEPRPHDKVDPTSYLLFSAWFDRGPQEYLAALHRCLGDRAERIWRHCGFDGGDSETFGRYLLEHQVEASSKFHGYDGVTVAQVRGAVETAERFRDFAVAAQGMDADELRAAWRTRFG